MTDLDDEALAALQSLAVEEVSPETISSLAALGEAPT